jgi:carbonic anhydrase
MRTPFAGLAALVAAAVAASASAGGAGTWQAVATSGAERAEIDRARIMRTAPGRTLAWTRLMLGREATDAGGSYTSVQAMNRYDCEARTFATLKRVYMDGEKAIREESIASPKEIVARAGSADAWLLSEACKPRPVAEDHRVTEEAAKQAVAGQEGKLGVMHADMRTAGEAPKVQTLQVADAGKPEPKADAKTEPRPGSAAETKIEIRPPNERPRFIDLPKKETPQAAAPAPPEAKAPQTRPADAKALARSIEAVMSSAGSRHERERILATSGPRRIAAERRYPGAEVPLAVIEHRGMPWSYEGEAGPANWAKLRSDYGLCAIGKRQSPIDIREGIRVDLEPIKFDYRPSQFRIVDTGHTIQASVGEGSTMTVMGRTYRLIEFHFHRPAEERINGKAFDMVIHFTHRDDLGKVAMIAVLLEKGVEHSIIQALWNNMPLEVNQDVTPSAVLDLNKLLPEDRAYYTYMGSLTTPPCTEDVLWMVFKQPVPVSVDQIAIFSRLYRNNARPIQPSNNRLVKENR